MATVNVCETFISIQGESTYAGLSCYFVRLAGCNLDCTYCDTPQSKPAGKDMDIDRIAAECAASDTEICEITGGEPLLQPAYRELAAALHKTGRPVLTETNGSCDISAIPDRVIAIMDIKTPGSGMTDSFDRANIERLRQSDEVKFVITDRADYDWAKEITLTEELVRRCNAVLFSPVDGKAKQLSGWILEDGLSVRLNVQLHKLIGVK